MTYQEALDFRKSLPYEIEEDHLTMEILIAPAGADDFHRFTTDYRSGGFDDETARLYSFNNQFIVAGLWTDGTDVIWKDLTKKN